MTVSANYPLLTGSIPTLIDDADADALPHDVTKVTNHVEKGLSRFIEQYKDKPRMEVIAESFLIENQAIEDAAFDVYTLRFLDNATDAQLANLGKIVGQSNPGVDDDNYRILIRARIAVNRSNGKPDEMINILLLLSESFAEPAVVLYVEGGTASWALHMTSDIGTIDPDLVWGLMIDSADPAGVDGTFVFGYSPTTELFRWSSSAGTVTHDSQGFESSVTPGNGGKLSSARGS